MSILVFVIWVVAGVLAAINHLTKRADETYWIVMFWLTYVVLMICLISNMLGA